MLACPFAAGVPFAECELARLPYAHFTTTNVLDPEVSVRTLEWLELEAEWRRREGEFYRFDECYPEASAVPPPYPSVFSQATRQAIARRLEALFDVALAGRSRVVAHRMLPSHRIEIHNDAPGVGSETHRFIVSLNREWRGDHGGYLAFLDGPSWDLLSDVYRPIHNTGAGLELSERSYHAVTEVKALARYTILYSFWPAARQGGTR